MSAGDTPGSPKVESNAGASASTGRPRSEEAHKAILEATIELLAEVGFSALTVEGVATRAGVGKATIYRRWPSKLPLVVEAFGQLPSFEACDTGSLGGDLKRMLRSYIETFNATALAAVLPSLAGERAHNPELDELFTPVSMGRRRPLTEAFERARDRGEIAADLDIELATDIVVGPIAVTLFFKGGRLSTRHVGAMVDLALRGILQRG